jgi:hypothetical protein
MAYKINYKELEEILGIAETELLEEISDYINEMGIPVAVMNDPSKYAILSDYVKYSDNLNSLMYQVENQLKRLILKRAIEESKRSKEMKEYDGIRSTSERKEMLLSDTSASTTKLIDLNLEISKVESVKWLLFHKLSLVTNILKLY